MSQIRANVIELFAVSEELVYDGPQDYVDYAVDVPAGVTGLRIELDFVKVTDRFQLYAALLEPSGRFRGHVQCPGGPGPRTLAFEVGATSASPGAIPGDITEGRWILRLDLDRFRESGRYDLRMSATSTPAQVADVAPATVGPVDRLPREVNGGWLRSELHTHSVHSDGRPAVDEILAAGTAAGLDVLALSDHFTWSHWEELDSAATPDSPVTLRSIEVTTHRGHANIHGLQRWPDLYVDRADRDCGALVREVHAQGGLFGINHPFSGEQAWRRSDVAWSEVDLLEVVNQGQYANNDAAIGLWDRLLAQGFDIAPVAGTDSHDVADPAQRLGQVYTLLKADERSGDAALRALRNAATVVSRGSLLDFRLVSDTTAQLGQQLVLASQIAIEIDLDAVHDGTVFIIRDGLMWHQESVSAGRSRLRLVDESPVVGAYRVELHRRSDDERYWASAWRSHESFEALTSFIRVVPAPEHSQR